MTITQDELKRLFSYNRNTGILRNRIQRGSSRKGHAVGINSDRGRLVLKIHRKTYQVHRLIWMYVYGHWPKHGIDHIDGNPSNNRLANLRDVPAAHNAQNRHGPQANSKSGVLGVVVTRHGRWRAQVQFKGVSYHVGCYTTKEEAHAAYLKAKRAIHPGCTI